MNKTFKRQNKPFAYEPAKLADAKSLVIQEDMRVDGFVFRAGSPVSNVLEAAAAAYRKHPLITVSSPRIGADTKSWVRHIYDTYVMPANSHTNVALVLSDLFDAFMVTGVAGVDRDDRESFEARLKERLS